jgi:hypothetical protein
MIRECVSPVDVESFHLDVKLLGNDKQKQLRRQQEGGTAASQQNHFQIVQDSEGLEPARNLHLTTNSEKRYNRVPWEPQVKFFVLLRSVAIWCTPNPIRLVLLRTKIYFRDCFNNTIPERLLRQFDRIVKGIPHRCFTAVTVQWAMKFFCAYKAHAALPSLFRLSYTYIIRTDSKLVFATLSSRGELVFEDSHFYLCDRLIGHGEAGSSCPQMGLNLVVNSVDLLATHRRPYAEALCFLVLVVK